MAPGFEALHFGFWLQEVIWDRKDGYTIPIEARSFLPGEATIMRDPCRRFVGYQVGSHYRDARYALLTVNNPHIDPIFGESRNEYCREEWWRARQSEENADKTERKAAGMQMGLGVPQGATFLDERGNAIFPREMAENLVNAAVRGDCFTYPLTAFSKQDCIRNPALMDIPAVKVTQYDWGNNGPALTAHLSRISAIDRKIMMARMRPSREAMEGTSGTRAEAGVHGQIGVTDSELVAAQQLSQITTQVLDRWAVTNFGAKAAGMLVAKQAPLSDPQQQFLQDVYKALCSGQKPDPETVAQIDRRALGKRVEMPLLDQKTVEATLAMQQGGAEPLSTVSSGQRGGETLSQYPALAADNPAALTPASPLTGGEWRTIKGARVYIKDGAIAAGPAGLLGKSLAQFQPQQIGQKSEYPDSWWTKAKRNAAGEKAAELGGYSDDDLTDLYNGDPNDSYAAAYKNRVNDWLNYFYAHPSESGSTDIPADWVPAAQVWHETLAEVLPKYPGKKLSDGIHWYNQKTLKMELERVFAKKLDFYANAGKYVYQPPLPDRGPSMGEDTRSDSEIHAYQQLESLARKLDNGEPVTLEDAQAALMIWEHARDGTGLPGLFGQLLVEKGPELLGNYAAMKGVSGGGFTPPPEQNLELVESRVPPATTAEEIEASVRGYRTVPQGLTASQFNNATGQLSVRTGELGGELVIQGSRANGTAKLFSDIDFGIRVSPARFDELIAERFGTPNPNSANFRTMQRAIATGKIQAGEAGLSALRRDVQGRLGIDADVSIIKIGGPFDSPGSIAVPSQR